MGRLEKKPSLWWQHFCFGS